MVLLSAVVVYAADSTGSSKPAIAITMLNQDPNPATAGDVVNLNFKIENTGTQPASNFKVKLVEDYPFTVVNGIAEQDFSSINAYQTDKNYVNVQYTVKVDPAVIQGQRQLELDYSYSDGVWVSALFTVDITNKEFAQISYVDKARLDPGKETNMTFVITNTGNAPLQNMVFSWQEPTGVILPVYSSDTKYVKFLDIGKSVDLTYIVIADVNADAGLYQLNLNLKSQSVGGSNTSSVINTRTGVFVGGGTDFDVAFSESSAGVTSLSVANIGNNPAQSVSVMIPQQPSFRVTGTNSAIIGNLAKGDYTLVSFQIASATAFNATGASASTSLRRTTQTTLPGAQAPPRSGNFTRGAGAGGNNLQVVIEYTDTAGERKSVEKSVPIQFRSSGLTTTSLGGTSRSSSSSFIGSTYFWLLIIAVVIVGCVVIMNKRAKTLISKRK